MKPNYTELGFASLMGPQLKELVEQQLIEDLKVYGNNTKVLQFDWSESCIEGHETSYLDGVVENFSGIKVFNEQDALIAEGWMEFIHEPSDDFFIAYWEFLTLIEASKLTQMKENVGVSPHIFMKIPENVRCTYQHQVMHF